MYVNFVKMGICCDVVFNPLWFVEIKWSVVPLRTMALWLIRKGKLQCTFPFPPSLEGESGLAGQHNCTILPPPSLSLSPFDVNFRKACGPLILSFPATIFIMEKRGIGKKLKIKISHQLMIFPSFHGWALYMCIY